MDEKEDSFHLIDDNGDGGTSFCYVKLNPGISKFNLLSLYLCYISCIMNIEFLYTFMPLILSDKKYYAVPLDKVPALIGLSAMVA